PLGQPDRAEVDALVEAQAVGAAHDELGRAAADVDQESLFGKVASDRRAPEGQLRLLVATRSVRSAPRSSISRRKSTRTLRARAIGAGRRRFRSSTPSPSRVIFCRRTTSSRRPSSTSVTSRRMELVPRSTDATRTASGYVFGRFRRWELYCALRRGVEQSGSSP